MTTTRKYAPTGLTPVQPPSKRYVRSSHGGWIEVQSKPLSKKDRHMSKTTATPTPASPITVLVVGGEHRFVQGTLSSNLARHGMLVVGHWDWKMRQPPTTLPAGLACVYVATDMVGHNLSNAAVALAKAGNIPLVNGTRKWAESSGRLVRAGFPEIIKTPPVASGGTFPTKERRKFYASCFVENPAISNADLEILIFSYAAEHNYTSGDSLDPAMASQMRREFGVTFGRGPLAKATVNLTSYVAACMSYGFEPKPHVAELYGNNAGYPSAVVTAAAAAPAPAPTPEVRPAMVVAPPVEVKPAAPAPAPKVEPVPTPSSVIGNGSPSWMSDDLRVALQLVRAQFEALGIESITLTKTSTKFRRAVVIIEEGDVQI